MKILKKLAIAVVALVLLLVAVGFVLPAKYATERSLVIDAPAEKIFDHVAHLQANEAWSPWIAQDPTIKTTYSSTKAVGVGAWSSWTSENSGSGKMTIEVADRPHRIVNDLDFGQQGRGKGLWTFEAAGEKTKVTWRMEGDAGDDIVGRWFGTMIDTFVGPSFELGLNRLKEVCEKSS